MKRLILLFLILFFLNGLIAQEKALEIFDEITAKEIIIRENKRIRIKTFEGEKISGRFKIFDNETIILKNETIKLSQIEKIKKNPLVVSIITNGILFYCGVALIGVSVFIYAFSGDVASFLFTIPAAVSIYGGIKSPNILIGYKATGNWKYEIIKIPE
jgi:small nuclear ribonucleoprotein (snRNP)-like protein